MHTATPTASYGADEAGLVYGYLFSPGVCGGTLASEQASAWLHDPSSRQVGEFMWLHFNAAHISTEKWLRAHLDLPEAFFEALHEGSRSTRIELADGTLVSVLNDVIYDFAHVESLQVSTLAERRRDKADQRPAPAVALGGSVTHGREGGRMLSVRRCSGRPPVA
jgi:zinc transporter